MIGYRVRDNRGMYWRWYRHAKSSRWGVWDSVEVASTVYNIKELNNLLRDVLRTIRGNKADLFNIMIQSAGIVVEEIEISIDVKRAIPVPINEQNFRVKAGELKETIQGGKA